MISESYFVIIIIVIDDNKYDYFDYDYYDKWKLFHDEQEGRMF